MRMLMGLIVGAVLTIGAAWWVDQGVQPGETRMVNWEIVGRRVEQAQIRIRDGWKSLVASFDRRTTEPARSDSAT